MGFYKIDWKPSIYGELKKIDKRYLSKIIKKVESLAENPFPSGVKKLIDSEGNYRVRIGDYRIIYKINIEEKIVLINYVRHRKDIYRKR